MSFGFDEWKREPSWPDNWREGLSIEYIMSDAFFQAPAVLVKEPERQEFSPENCPARCRRTGRCYGVAWFEHKCGKPIPCQKTECKHFDRFQK